eukprot:47824-Amphidinium_carterae.1
MAVTKGARVLLFWYVYLVVESSANIRGRTTVHHQLKKIHDKWLKSCVALKLRINRRMGSKQRSVMSLHGFNETMA